MKSFDIPAQYRSSVSGKIKEERKLLDPRKKDFSPSLLDFGPVRIYLARHFGFCYGVENAIEISYKALDENKGKRIFLLSQMIHNPEVNKDLENRGIQFIMDTEGKQFIPWNELKTDDVVIVPAFGTTLEIEAILREKGINIEKYNTTCPFVERVWNRAEKLGESDYTIIIHGKNQHEETRATFSHSRKSAPSLVVKDITEAVILGEFISGNRPFSEFDSVFKDRYSDGFDPEEDLKRIGVINQTTMLATETQEIADYLKSVMQKKFPAAELKNHFSDTRDTLCYATNDNQQATYALMEKEADLSIVIGGYNSSNTSHLVELLEKKYPTFFIANENEIVSRREINSFDIHTHSIENKIFLPEKDPVTLILSSGASCPDALVDRVLLKVLSFFPDAKPVESVIESFGK